MDNNETSIYGDRRAIDRDELLTLLRYEAERRAEQAATLSTRIGEPDMIPDQVVHGIAGLMREVAAIEAIAEVIAADTKHAPTIPDHWHYDYEHGWIT